MKIIHFIVILLITFSCKDKIQPSSICDVANPSEELPWLKAEIDRRKKSQSDIEKYFFIEQGEYNGQTVFLYNNCCPMCNTIISVYDCSGKKIFELSPGIEITNLKMSWQPKDCPCQSA